jgi:hypothetical protein
VRRGGVLERERKNINEPTMRGNQFDQSAQERMIIKNPTARTKERRITARYRGIYLFPYSLFSFREDVLLRPAAMSLYLDKGFHFKFICIGLVAITVRKLRSARPR